MNNLYAPVELYPFLRQFCLMEQTELRDNHINALKHLLKSELPGVQLQCEGSQTNTYIVEREKIFRQVVSSYFEEQTKKIAKANLEAVHSFEILTRNAHLMDSIIHVAFDFTLDDLPILKDIQVIESQKELAFKKRVLPEKEEKLSILASHLDTVPEEHGNISERVYYQEIHRNLEEEIEEYRQKIKQLQEQLTLLQKWYLDPQHILECMVIFARGGYGRGELSFSSDRDVGYCLNPQRLNVGEFELLKQFIIRLEYLLNQTGIETAHQYFEIDEDLSRFTQPETLHTIPSILESRSLLGNDELMVRLKQRFFEFLPYESYVLSKLHTYQSADRPELNKMDLKEEFGGLRTLQIPLWIAAATLGIFSSQTAELLALLIEKHILSPRQTLELSQALELLYDLRNFVGATEKFYYDEEAKSAGIRPEDWQSNVISDNLEKLYLLKKNRFKNFDEFDRFRLRIVFKVQELSEMILNNLLDRNIVRTFSNFQATVNLRQQRIIEIRAIEGLPQIPLSLVFSNPAMLLDLFIYIGNSGYCLSSELKDEMSNVVHTITAEVIEAHRFEIQDRFTKIMLSPHVAQALRTMFEIYDPSHAAAETDTLIGRFIPECNQMRFLLRNLNYHQYTVCEHTLKALENSRIELEYLKKNYTDLFHFLRPKHLLALKWGILFHDVGKIDPKTKHQESGTSIAVHALERLGYQDEELFNLVSLLIFHHMTFVELSKTSTYFDQALQRSFEMADRDLIRMILLFLINISDYSAVSESTAKDTKNLRTFFNEAYHAYIEIRMSSETKNPIELINIYLDNQKKSLESATRINMLIHRSLNEGLNQALIEPLSKINSREYERLQVVKKDWELYWRYLKMGSLDEKGVEQYTEKLTRSINQYVSGETLLKLTEDIQPIFNWFFTTFPNRYLLGQSPDVLWQKVLEFAEFEKRSIFSTVVTPHGKVVGTLIFVHNRPKILHRVAYGMSIQNINIRMAKMNKILFEDGRLAYCYYFEANGITQNMVFAKKLEENISTGTLPVLDHEPLTRALYQSKLHLEFLENDNKGYEVVQQNGNFTRQNRDFRVVKITTQDAPLLFYKLSEAFDQVGVAVQQTLITTTGTHVNDYFYVTESDCKRLRNSNFEEILKTRFLN